MHGQNGARSDTYRFHPHQRPADPLPRDRFLPIPQTYRLPRSRHSRQSDPGTEDLSGFFPSPARDSCLPAGTILLSRHHIHTALYRPGSSQNGAPHETHRSHIPRSPYCSTQCRHHRYTAYRLPPSVPYAADSGRCTVHSSILLPVHSCRDRPLC